MKGYNSYKKALDKKQNNIIEKIKYWDMLKKDYECQIKENSIKQDEIHNLKFGNKKLETSLNVALQRIEELEQDIKSYKKSKKTK